MDILNAKVIQIWKIFITNLLQKRLLGVQQHNMLYRNVTFSTKVLYYNIKSIYSFHKTDIQHNQIIMIHCRLIFYQKMTLDNILLVRIMTKIQSMIICIISDIVFVLRKKVMNYLATSVRICNYTIHIYAIKHIWDIVH